MREYYSTEYMHEYISIQYMHEYYIYLHIITYIYIHRYICTRNYALAIASASFPAGSHGNPLGITLGSRISEPKVMVLDP